MISSRHFHIRTRLNRVTIRRCLQNIKPDALRILLDYFPPIVAICGALYAYFLRPYYMLPIVLSVPILALLLRGFLHLYIWCMRPTHVSATNTLQIRKSHKYDGELLHDVLVRSFAPIYPGELSSAETFTSWLQCEDIQFRIVELMGKNRKCEDAVGFYSIFPLNMRACKLLVGNRLHHNSINHRHLSRLRVDSDENNTSSEICLFILDLEAIRMDNGHPNPFVGTALIVDLVAQIGEYLQHNNVRFVLTLGASEYGKNWAKKLNLKKLPMSYYPTQHGTNENEWHLYQAEGDELLKFFKPVFTSSKWPYSNISYPYDFDKINRQKALKALGSRLVPLSQVSMA